MRGIRKMMRIRRMSIWDGKDEKIRRVKNTNWSVFSV